MMKSTHFAPIYEKGKDMNGMSALTILLILFVIFAACIAVWTSTRPAPDKLWISVVLLCIVEAVRGAISLSH